MNPQTEHTLRSTDLNPFARDMSKDPKEGDAADLKKLCQKIHIGLAIIADELLKNPGLNVRDAILRCKEIAKEGDAKLYLNNKFHEIGLIAKQVRSDIKRANQKQVIYLATRINGKRSVKTEDMGGNVGPVVEPGSEEMAEKLAFTDEVVAACIGRIRFLDLQEVKS